MLAVAFTGSHHHHHRPSDKPSGPWLKVAICEEGGHNDPTYGYLGIYPSTWSEYGGTRYSKLAGGTGWLNQVRVANAIEPGNYVPDQYGCAGSW